MQPSSLGNNEPSDTAQPPANALSDQAVQINVHNQRSQIFRYQYIIVVPPYLRFLCACSFNSMFMTKSLCPKPRISWQGQSWKPKRLRTRARAGGTFSRAGPVLAGRGRTLIRASCKSSPAPLVPRGEREPARALVVPIRRCALSGRRVRALPFPLTPLEPSGFLCCHAC